MVDTKKTAEAPVEDGPVEVDALSQMGATFAERAKASKAQAKKVAPEDAEDKAVKKSESKATRKK